MISNIVRVAANNNFNCTKKEWTQLKSFNNPSQKFFVNSNINTPLLYTIINHDYPAVITANPDLTPPSLDFILSKLLPIIKNIAFVRVKYLPENIQINNLITTLLENKFKVVITNQRFNSKKTLLAYTNLDYYSYEDSRYRIKKNKFHELETFVDDLKKKNLPIWICDQKEMGCKECRLCSILTFNDNSSNIVRLNLKTSGICPYNCPDCYAKTMQNFLIKVGKNPLSYNTISANEKQAGKTVHIKRRMAAIKDTP